MQQTIQETKSRIKVLNQSLYQQSCSEEPTFITSLNTTFAFFPVFLFFVYFYFSFYILGSKASRGHVHNSNKDAAGDLRRMKKKMADELVAYKKSEEERLRLRNAEMRFQREERQRKKEENWVSEYTVRFLSFLKSLGINKKSGNLYAYCDFVFFGGWGYRGFAMRRLQKTMLEE